jgi:hypothetical protein
MSRTSIIATSSPTAQRWRGATGCCSALCRGEARRHRRARCKPGIDDGGGPGERDLMMSNRAIRRLSRCSAW